MDSVIDPHIFRDSVLWPSSSSHINFATNGTRTELLPGAGKVCLRYDLLGFVVNLNMDYPPTHTKKRLLRMQRTEGVTCKYLLFKSTARQSIVQLYKPSTASCNFQISRTQSKTCNITASGKGGRVRVSQYKKEFKEWRSDTHTHIMCIEYQHFQIQKS